MAFRFTFFNTPKPRVFNYQPLYFDPEKERWEQRKAQLYPKTAEEARLFRPGGQIRGSFQRARFESRRKTGENRYIRAVVIISIVVLFIAALYLADGVSFLYKSISIQPTP